MSSNAVLCKFHVSTDGTDGFVARLSRVPCNDELVNASGRTFVVETVIHQTREAKDGEEPVAAVVIVRILDLSIDRIEKLLAQR